MALDSVSNAQHNTVLARLLRLLKLERCRQDSRGLPRVHQLRTTLVARAKPMSRRQHQGDLCC